MPEVASLENKGEGILAKVVGFPQVSNAPAAAPDGATIYAYLRGGVFYIRDALGVEVPVVMGNVLATEAGTGITTGTGVVYQSSVSKEGGIITTRILIDLTGLTSADSDLDVMGVEDTALPCHIGQITTALNGTIFAGKATCLEVPASLDDFDIYSAGDGTLVYEDLITSEADEVALITSGAAWTAGLQRIITGIPPADSYLYLVNGAIDTPADFTAGKFMIELYGT